MVKNIIFEKILKTDLSYFGTKLFIYKPETFNGITKLWD